MFHTFPITNSIRGSGGVEQQYSSHGSFSVRTKPKTLMIIIIIQAIKNYKYNISNYKFIITIFLIIIMIFLVNYKYINN